MSAADNAIGQCRCPVCGNLKASLRVSVKQLAYIVCNGCNVQAFARSDQSDQLLRAMLVAAPGAPVLESAPAPAPVPSQAPPAPAPPPARAATGWGVLRG